jgi:MFS family permease
MFEVAYIMAAPVIGFSLKRVGRKNYIILGYLIVVLGTIGFAVLALVENE